MFQVGDKVRRSSGHSFPEYNMFLGHIYTITQVITPTSLSFEECPSHWLMKHFELIRLKEKTGFGKFIGRIEECSK